MQWGYKRWAALVKQAVAMEQVPELKAPRKLVVLEEWEAEEERGTQTEAVAGAEVGCQTAVFSLKRHDQQSFVDVATQCYEGTARPTAAAASQTAPADLGPKMVEVVVGKGILLQLYLFERKIQVQDLSLIHI